MKINLVRKTKLIIIMANFNKNEYINYNIFNS